MKARSDRSLPVVGWGSYSTLRMISFSQSGGMRSGGWALGRDSGTNAIFLRPTHGMTFSQSSRHPAHAVYENGLGPWARRSVGKESPGLHAKAVRACEDRRRAGPVYVESRLTDIR